MASQAPHRPAVISAHGSCTFAELVAEADRLAAALASSDIPEGSVIATDLPTGVYFFALALATLRSGYGLFPIDREVPEPVRSTLLRVAGAALDVRSEPSGAPRDDPSTSIEDLLARAPDTAPPGCAPRAGYLVSLTSGTTGDAKVAKRAQPWYPYRGVVVFERYGAGPGDGPHVMSNPEFHAGTIGPALYALQAGSAVVVQSDWSPEVFVGLVDQHQADSAFLSPDYLVQFALAGRAPLRAPRVVLHGGGSCGEQVKRAAMRLLGPVLLEFYGTSATGVITEITSADWLRRPGSVGRPLRGVRLSIETAGRPVTAGSIGEICVSPRVLDRTTETGGKLRTGDAGWLDEDGFLYVVGRLSEGSSSREAVVEQLVRSLPGVQEVVVLPRSDAEMDCFVETEPVHAAALETRIREVAAQAGVHSIDLRMRPAGFFPRTSSGKVRRAGLASSSERLNELSIGGPA